MKRILLTAVFGALGVTGCVTSPMPPNGALFSNIQGPNRSQEGHAEASKRGESCAESVLGLVAWGDASIDSAAKANGIKKVSAVDYSNFDVLSFVYTKTCAIVTGS